MEHRFVPIGALGVREGVATLILDGDTLVEWTLFLDDGVSAILEPFKADDSTHATLHVNGTVTRMDWCGECLFTCTVERPSEPVKAFIAVGEMRSQDFEVLPIEAA